VTLRIWFRWFWTTLAVGVAASMVVWAALKALVPGFVFDVGVGWYEPVLALLGGATISVLAQMGFFAFLMLRYVALGMFGRRTYLLNALQAALTAVALLDLALLGVWLVPERSVSAGDVALAAVVGGAGALVAYRKSRLTNRSAFWPTWFFMSAVTAVEAVPALRTDATPHVWFMTLTLLACNAWQIMSLSSWVDRGRLSETGAAAGDGGASRM